MPFRITIIETGTQKKTVTNEWGDIGEREVKRDAFLVAQDPDEPKTRIERVRGFLPPHEKDMPFERKILEQEVLSIDLVAVIKAVNGID